MRGEHPSHPPPPPSPPPPPPLCHLHSSAVLPHSWQVEACDEGLVPGLGALQQHVDQHTAPMIRGSDRERPAFLHQIALIISNVWNLISISSDRGCDYLAESPHHPLQENRV